MPYWYKQGHTQRADPDPLIRVEGYVYIKTVCINSIHTVACLGFDFGGKAGDGGTPYWPLFLFWNLITRESLQHLYLKLIFFNDIFKRKVGSKSSWRSLACSSFKAHYGFISNIKIRLFNQF